MGARGIMLIGLLVTCPLFAAENDAPAQAEPEQAPANDAPAETVQVATPPAPQSEDSDLTAPPSDEDFVPTVRITEDLPVAFPVDI